MLNFKCNGFTLSHSLVGYFKIWAAILKLEFSLTGHTFTLQAWFSYHISQQQYNVKILYNFQWLKFENHLEILRILLNGTS